MDVVRITELQPKTYVEQGDYIAIDNQSDGTKKVQFTNLLDSNLSTQNKAADALATGQAISELNNDIDTEALARQSTDNSLQSQINQLVAPSGTAPNPAEIENARIGADGVTYDTLGNAIRTQATNLKSDLAEVENDTGIKYIQSVLVNGTPPNPGNANAVSFKTTIPLEYGTTVEVFTDRPNTEGYTYYYGQHIYNSNDIDTWGDNYPNGPKRFTVDQSYYKGIRFAIVERDSNGNYNPLRITDFAGYRVWIAVTSANAVDDVRKDIDFLVPVLRDGSIANPGNASAISTMMVAPINTKRRLEVEYVGDMEEGDHLSWSVYFFRASAAGKRANDCIGTADYIVVFDLTGEENSRTYDITSILGYQSTQEAKYIGISVWRVNSGGTNVPLRVKTSGNDIVINYYNDPGVDAIRDEIKTAFPRETFAYLGNGGHFVFKDFPRFGANTGRCALRTDEHVIVSFANHEITDVTWNTFVSQIGASDTLESGGYTWLYLRPGYAAVFDVVEKVFKTTQIAGANKMSPNYVPILLAWSHQFVGGLLCSKVYDEMYSVPNTLFNSSNVLYPIDIKTKATEFTDIISENTDSESFLFFTDPHTYSKYWNTLESAKNSAEYLQTVIQKYYNSTPTNFVLCGGDWLTDTDTVSEAKYKLGLIESSMEGMVSPYYPVFGNHDSNYQGAEALSNGEVTNLWFSKWGKNYYTFNGANTKFYVFDSQLDNISSMTSYFWEQIDWFGKSLESETSAHIAIAIHIWLNGGEVAPLATVLTDFIRGYNARDIMEFNGITYDFQEATGRIEFVLAGHIHNDAYEIIDESVPVIITTNAWSNPNVCFDLVFADYTARTITCVRVGTGNNRKFSLNTGEIINE